MASPPSAARVDTIRSRADSVARGVRWFPDTTAFAPLLADPRDTWLRGGFVLADRPNLDDGPQPSDFDGRNIEAEVSIGHRLPVVRLQRESADAPSIVVGFEVGIFSRFFMETSQKDLINADFRVGAPVSFGYRDWEARIELRHISSHFGDDYVNRFSPDLKQVSQEGFELLLARHLHRDLRVYVGGAYNFGATNTERTSGQAGLEYDPGSRVASRNVWPYVAADVRITSLTQEAAGTGVGGVGFRVEGFVIRLEGRGHFGPSPMGRFRTVDENFWGLGLRIEP